jgi:type IV secretion system protein VirB8
MPSWLRRKGAEPALPADAASQKAADSRPNESSEEAYFRAATGWDLDRMSILQRAERRAWLFSVLFAIVAAASVVAIVLMLPLKTVEPFVIRVDNATGIVDVVNSLRTSKNTYEESISKYFLSRYIRAKEGYNPATFNLAYSEAGYLSSATMRDALYEEFNPANAGSPVNRYKQGEVSIQIKTISFLRSNIASVRYMKSVVGVDRPSITHWVATAEFRYLDAPAMEEARQYNPLGFQIVTFRTDPESGAGVAP